MTTITGQDVLNALMKYRVYRNQSDELIELLDPFILSLPEILKEFLDKKVTAPLLWQARIIFVEKYIEGKFFVKFIESLSDKHPLFTVLGPKEEIAKKGQEKLVDSLNELKKYLQELAYIDERAQDVVFRGIENLNKKVITKYLAGELTFADLLVMQPSVIVYL